MLKEQIKIKKEKGNNVFIKYDKLMIFINKENSESTDTRKRNLSISPQHNVNSENSSPRNTQAVKKNKTILPRTPPQRSSSFSDTIITRPNN